MSPGFSVVAIIAAFNEADIITHVVGDLIQQGVDVYFLDDGSTDDTVALVEPYLGKGVLAIERLERDGDSGTADRFAWERILLEKTRLATELDASWFIHHDADEFRESPWLHLSLADAIRRVDDLGFNAIDFSGLDFRPVDDLFHPGDDVRRALTFYDEPAPYDRLQIRAWKKTEGLDLVSSGGHEARFQSRRVFPVRFILRHYPIRGQAHGDRKVFQERQGRFLEQERARGWHVQYDDIQEGTSFIRDESTLTRYDPDGVRLALTLRHRGVEALKESLEDQERALHACREELTNTREELRARSAEAATLHAELHLRNTELMARNIELDVRTGELAARNAEAAGLRNALAERALAIAQLQRAVDDAARRLEEVHQSLSWRWTSPARAVYRWLRRP